MESGPPFLIAHLLITWLTWVFPMESSSYLFLLIIFGDSDHPSHYFVIPLLFRYYETCYLVFWVGHYAASLLCAYESCYEFHLWKSFLYEMAIWWGPSWYQCWQTPEHCIWGPDITWAKGFLFLTRSLIFLTRSLIFLTRSLIFLTRSLIFLGGIHQRSPQPLWCAIAIAIAISSNSNSNSNSNNNNWAWDAHLKPQEVFFPLLRTSKVIFFFGFTI